MGCSGSFELEAKLTAGKGVNMTQGRDGVAIRHNVISMKTFELDVAN